MTNRQVTLSSRPHGYPTLSDFSVLESQVPEPAEGEVLVKALWLSLDPYMRGRMNDAKSYAPSVQIGEVIVGGVVGRIERSRTPAFSEGEIVTGPLGWREYALSDGRNLSRVDTSLGPISTALGVLGMPGMTAYFGFLDVAAPTPGDTVVVSAASGAVGQLVTQISSLMGCRTIGIAGTDAKVDYVVSLGANVGINYKTQNITSAIESACPNGVDVYFDNVGGPITDAVIDNLATGARISVCGQISQYNLEEPEPGPRNMRALITNQARMEGFLVTKFSNRFDEARGRIAAWIREGNVTYKEDVVEGIENAPDAFMGLMRGDNFGKLLVKVSEE